MREINFRVWDKQRKKICAVHNLAFHDEIYGYSVITIEEAARGGDFHATFTTIEKFELMQYTGLKDKNSVDIYEGDIVIHNGELSKVKWSEKYCQFRLEGSKVTTGLNFYHFRHYEVIGNVYDNPKLLEVAK